MWWSKQQQIHNNKKVTATKKKEREEGSFWRKASSWAMQNKAQLFSLFPTCFQTSHNTTPLTSDSLSFICTSSSSPTHSYRHYRLVISSILHNNRTINHLTFHPTHSFYFFHQHVHIVHTVVWLKTFCTSQPLLPTPQRRQYSFLCIFYSLHN